MPRTINKGLCKVVSLQETACEYKKLDSPERLAEFWKEHVTSHSIFDPEKEHVVMIALDTRLAVKGWHIVSIGSINESVASPREVYRPAIAHAAYGIVLMHNHPSGDPAPSRGDVAVTNKLKEAGSILEIRLIDHIIMGKPQPGRTEYYSFLESGIL